MNRLATLDDLIARHAPAVVGKRVRACPAIRAFLDKHYPCVPIAEQLILYRAGMSRRPRCPVCQAEIVWKRGSQRYPRTCSRKCSGRDSVAAQRRKLTMLKRYGRQHALQCDEARSKRDQTMLRRYGSKSALHVEAIKERHSEALKAVRPETQARLLQKADEVHGSKYDYSRVHYKGWDQKVTILCPDHGSFEQLLVVHARGHGCPKCSAERLGTQRRSSNESFIKKARALHGARYDYSKVSYVTAQDSVSILCPQHGLFLQRANDHLSGYGCPTCGRASSLAEEEIADFLHGLGIETVHRRDRNLLAPRELDLYVEEAALAIEYCGLHWHSDAVNRNRYHLLEKHLACEKQGIRLITLFEDEWLTQQCKVKAILRHILGRSERGCYARKAFIAQIPWSEARVFLDRHHLLGAGGPGFTSVGAFSGTELVGVMTFGLPANEQGSTHTVEMKRFVTDGRNNPGLASRMFRWSVRQYNLSRVSAFVDRRWFTGTFKRISGFEVVGQTAPSLWWTRRAVRYHRRFTTKQKLLELYPEMSPRMSKLDMMRSLGYSRIWDCGKLKLEWSSR